MDNTFLFLLVVAVAVLIGAISFLSGKTVRYKEGLIKFFLLGFVVVILLSAFFIFLGLFRVH